jgi:hypothetical protein
MTANPIPIRDALAGASADPDDRRAVLREIVDRALGEHADKATITVAELAEVMHISRAGAYEAIRRGDCPSIHLGERRVVVPVPAIAAMLLGAQDGNGKQQT